MSTTVNSVSPSLLATMNPTSSTSTSSTSDSGSLAGASASQLQNNFLTMLMTQMENQNPLSPMDNSQITSQLAGLSTVQGISQMNTQMTSMISALQSSQSMQAANLIGKAVVVPGNAVTLSSGTGQFGISLPSAATNVDVTIKNSAGVVVDTMKLGAMASGQNAVTWNGAENGGGTAKDGNYTFTVNATNGSTAVTATALSVGLVESVSTSTTAGAQLNIPNLGSVNYSSVLQIL